MVSGAVARPSARSVVSVGVRGTARVVHRGAGALPGFAIMREPGELEQRLRSAASDPFAGAVPGPGFGVGVGQVIRVGDAKFDQAAFDIGVVVLHATRSWCPRGFSSVVYERGPGRTPARRIAWTHRVTRQPAWPWGKLPMAARVRESPVSANVRPGPRAARSPVARPIGQGRVAPYPPLAPDDGGQFRPRGVTCIPPGLAQGLRRAPHRVRTPGRLVLHRHPRRLLFQVLHPHGYRTRVVRRARSRDSVLRRVRRRLHLPRLRLHGVGPAPAPRGSRAWRRTAIYGQSAFGALFRKACTGATIVRIKGAKTVVIFVVSTQRLVLRYVVDDSGDHQDPRCVVIVQIRTWALRNGTSVG